MQKNPQGRAAADLIAAGARHVGFARIAAGMAAWGAEPCGIEQQQDRLADEQFDTMHLAPINFAASAALTCLDVCAAAAYRLFIGNPGRRESDLRKLKATTLASSAPTVAQWIRDTVAHPTYDDLLAVRKRMVHRDIPSTSYIGSHLTTTYRVGAANLTPMQATQLFAEVAEKRYPAFIDAVLAEL